MHLLKEIVHTASLQTDRAQAVASLRAKLAELHIPVEEEDRAKGEIVARCLTNAMNMIFWRCWSGGLLFEVRGIDETKTQISVFAISNLLRFKVGHNEKIIELQDLISHLFAQASRNPHTVR